MRSTIETEARRFAEAIAAAPVGAPVPTCPGWDAEDLLWHLTEVHYFWAGILANGVTTDEGCAAVDGVIPPRPATRREMLGLQRLATNELIGMLALLSDGEPRWSWFAPDQSVGFTRRMQTAEVTMHRVDAELTAALPVSAIDREVAAAIVDHAVDAMWWRDGAFEAVGIVAFEAEEGDHWLVEVGHADAVPAAVRAADGHASVVVRGAAEDIARWAWGRPGEVTIDGDGPAFDALNAILARGM